MLRFRHQEEKVLSKLAENDAKIFVVPFATYIPHPGDIYIAPGTHIKQNERATEELLCRAIPYLGSLVLDIKLREQKVPERDGCVPHNHEEFAVSIQELVPVKHQASQCRISWQRDRNHRVCREERTGVK